MANKVPRSKENDYTREMAEARRRFVQERTGTALEHVGSFSFDPGVLPGNVENFMGVAQVPIGLAGPLRIDGEHAKGDFFVPLATSEGTLVASYNRGMRLLSESGGVKTTVVEQFMQRSPVFILDDAKKARDFGDWIKEHFDAIKEVAETTTRSGKLINIGQYSIGPLRNLRFNYTTGDAAGQNMTGKATFAACEWIKKTYPGGANYILSGNMDTDKKHSRANMLLTRGKRVVAECTIKGDLLKSLMGISVEGAVLVAPGLQRRCVPRRLGEQRRARCERPHGDVHRDRPGRRQRLRVARRRHLRAAARQRRLLLVDHAHVADRRDLRRRHRAGDAARMPGDAGLLRQGQGRQVRRDLRRGRAGRRHLAVERDPCRRLGVEPRRARPQPALTKRRLP